MDYGDVLHCLQKDGDGNLSPKIGDGESLECDVKGLRYSGDLKPPIVGDPAPADNPVPGFHPIKINEAGELWASTVPKFLVASGSATGNFNTEITPGNQIQSNSLPISVPANSSCRYRRIILDVSYSATVVDVNDRVKFIVYYDLFRGTNSTTGTDEFNFDSGSAPATNSTFIRGNYLRMIVQQDPVSSGFDMYGKIRILNHNDNESNLGAFGWIFDWTYTLLDVSGYAL
jgi:hypothetical protein